MKSQKVKKYHSAPFVFLFYFFLFFWFPSKILAQEIFITEIQPYTIGAEKEWFEFSVQSEDPINISNFSVSNGKTTKKIRDIQSELIFPKDLILLTGSGSIPDYQIGDLFFTAQKKSYFAWEKSPISLKDDGGTIKILDKNDSVLHQIAYPKGKSGKTKNYDYGDIFNFDTIFQKLYPISYRNDLSVNFVNTKGFENKISPTPAEETVILISEISPDQKSLDDSVEVFDFIEIYFASGPPEINLKYMEIKYNGTPVYFFESDFWVQKGAFLTLKVGTENYGIVKHNPPYEIHSNKKTGLSTGSGTVELILFSGTAFETTEDFVCHQNKKLSQTESKRVSKNLESWSGNCIEIKDLIENESIARNVNFLDTNRAGDFFRHFNGSPGQENILQNKSPKAVITVQGSGKILDFEKLSINVTGENSTDPDGFKDISEFIWKLNGEIFSTEANPKSIKIEQTGKYELSLEVIDFGGDSDISVLELSVLEPGGAPIGSSSQALKYYLSSDFGDSKKKSHSKRKNEISVPDFFGDFLLEAPESFWGNLDQNKNLYENPKIDLPLFGMNYPQKRKSWIHKNIGFVLE